MKKLYKFILKLPISVFLISLLYSPTSIAQWQPRSTGLYGGNPVVFGASGETIFVGTWPGGVYRSNDNGQTWESVNNGLPRQTMMTAMIAKGGKIYTASQNSGFYVSENNGDSWQAKSNGLGNDQILSLILVGNDFFAGTFGGMFVLRENSDTWTKIGTGLPDWVGAVGVSGDYLLAGETYGKVYRSADQGVTWEVSHDGIEDDAIIESFVKVGAKTYVCANIGLYVSVNDGESWTKVDVAAGGFYQIINNGSTLLAFTSSGPYKSIDNGLTWTTANSGVGYRTILAAILHEGRVLIGGEHTGILISDDFGDSWTTSSTGFTSLNVSDMVVSGSDVFAGTSSGIYLSHDKGLNWESVNGGLSEYRQTTDLLLDGSVIYAGFDGQYTYSSPLPGNAWVSNQNGLTSTQVYELLKTGEHFFAATPHGVFKYSEEDSRWNLSDVGMPDDAIVSSLGAAGERIFASVYQHGVYISDDYGATWSNPNPGQPEVDFYGRRFLALGDTLFWGTHGIQISLNNGVDWKKLDTEFFNFVEAVISFDGYIFAAGWDGVFVSMDHGLSWTKSSEGFPDMEIAKSLAVVDDMLFAGTTGGVWSIPVSSFYPQITSLSAYSGHPGRVIEIYGKNFNSSSRNVVTFNGVEAEVLVATSNKLIVVVPGTATSGPVSVTVNNKTASAPNEFCVSRPAPLISADQLVIPALLTSNLAQGNQWYVDGMAIAGATGQTLAVNEPGIYTATATGECESVMSNEIELVVTGLEEIPSQGVQRLVVYPNPAESTIKVSLHDFEMSGEIRVDVYSAMGESIAEVEVKPGTEVSLNTTNYKSGIYFIRARQSGKVWVGKVFRK